MPDIQVKLSWVSLELSDFRVTSGAMLRLIESSLPAAYSPDGQKVRPDLQRVQQFEFEPNLKIRIWHLVWSLPAQARLKELENKTGSLEAFVLAGPASFVRLCGDFRAEEAPDGENLGEALAALGGDNVIKFLLERNLDVEAQLARIHAAVGDGTPASGAPCMGVDLRWGRSSTTRQNRSVAYRSEFNAVNGEWSVITLRNVSDYKDRKVLIENLIQGSEADANSVRTNARAAYEQEKHDHPWKILYDAKSSTSEADSFWRQARRDIIGFSPPISGEAVVMRGRGLPFYRGCNLIDIVDRRGGYPRTARFMGEYNEDGEKNVVQYNRILPIDWNSVTLHTKNASEKLELTAQTVRPYLKFFCENILGEEGYFRVIEDANELFWLGLAKESRERAAALVHPVELWTPQPVNGSWEGSERVFLLRASMIYSRALFQVVLAVRTNGMVDMLDEDPLAARLPIVPETISQKTHFIYLARAESDA